MLVTPGRGSSAFHLLEGNVAGSGDVEFGDGISPFDRFTCLKKTPNNPKQAGGRWKLVEGGGGAAEGKWHFGPLIRCKQE